MVNEIAVLEEEGEETILIEDEEEVDTITMKANSSSLRRLKIFLLKITRIKAPLNKTDHPTC